jgi:hypothetical protein
MAGLLVDGLAWRRLVRPGLPDQHDLATAAPGDRIVPGVTMSVLGLLYALATIAGR